MIRVLIVDDQTLVREGFRMILDAQDDIEVVGEAGDGVQALALARELAPDIVLMDIQMPRLDGLEATRRLLARDGVWPSVVMLTTSTRTSTSMKRSARAPVVFSSKMLHAAS